MSISVAIQINQRAWASRAAGLISSALFLIVCLIWGTTWLAIKIAVESVPPLTSAGLRFLIAFPLFLAFAWVRRESVFFPRGSGWFFAFITLTYFSVPYYLLNYGEIHVSSGLAALLFSSMPIFILLFSALFLRENIYPSPVSYTHLDVYKRQPQTPVFDEVLQIVGDQNRVQRNRVRRDELVQMILAAAARRLPDRAVRAARRAVEGRDRDVLHQSGQVPPLLFGVVGRRNPVFQLGVGPVSYTHLDVYKRQVLAHRPRRGLGHQRVRGPSGRGLQHRPRASGPPGHSGPETGPPGLGGPELRARGHLDRRQRHAGGGAKPDLSLIHISASSPPRACGGSSSSPTIPPSMPTVRASRRRCRCITAIGWTPCSACLLYTSRCV